ncbi:MAG TPA: TrbI/VirB10 family protein [Opitutaceae bacterium]
MKDGDPANPSGITLRRAVLLAGAAALAASAWFWKGPARVTPTPAVQQAAPLPTRLAPETLTQADANREAPPLSSGYRREVVRPKPVQDLADAVTPKDDPPAPPDPGGPASRRRDEKKTLPEIFRMPAEPGHGAEAPSRAAAPANAQKEGTSLADEFAPFGRLVKCELVDTLDSATARSEPIVALVTQDLDWNGNVIIPAGTEAFSYAKPEAVMDASGVGRLVDSGEWTLVLPGDADRANGRELILRARAVDRREQSVAERGVVRSWGMDDGADGLVGYTLSTLDNKEIKLFAAAAASGMAQGFAAVAERQQPASGVSGALGATQIAPTLGNALVGSLGAGTSEMMNEISSRIREEISKRGIYVRVPAGKAFYLFVEQTIDPRAASVGLRLAAGREGSR